MNFACTLFHCHLCSVQLYHIFSTLSYKRHDFRGGKKLNIKFVFDFLYIFYEIFLILRRTEGGIIINEYHVDFYGKYPLYLSDFNKIWMFSTDFRKMSKCQISWKAVKWEPSSSMRTGRWTYRQTWSSLLSLFAVLRKSLKYRFFRKFHQVQLAYCVKVCYRGADKSLARPTSRCILFDG